MKLLLDESLPRGLKDLIAGHDVATVPERGWAGSDNGALLTLAQEEFDAFLTADQNLRYQQNIIGFTIRVLVLRARRTRVPDLAPLLPAALEALENMRPGEVRQISSPDELDS